MAGNPEAHQYDERERSVLESASALRALTLMLPKITPASDMDPGEIHRRADFLTRSLTDALRDFREKFERAIDQYLEPMHDPLVLQHWMEAFGGVLRASVPALEAAVTAQDTGDANELRRAIEETEKFAELAHEAVQGFVAKRRKMAKSRTIPGDEDET